LAEATAREDDAEMRGGGGLLDILWLLGFSLHVGGALIHLLLILGLIVLIFNFFNGRRYA
jgi:hypothetical protein